MEKEFRFSNFWVTLLVSFIPWIMTSILLYGQMKIDNATISLVEYYDKRVEGFFNIIIGALVFTSIGITASSIMVSAIKQKIDDLSPILVNEKFKSREEEWYDEFRMDLNNKNWLYYLFILIPVSVILHYIGYGYTVIEEFNVIFYIFTLITLLLPNLIVASWVIWLVLAQYFHIYRFSKIENDDYPLSIGTKIDLKRFEFLRKFLPIETKPKKINVDIFNVDDLGGLNPLAELSLFGTLLMGIEFAVVVPVFFAANELFALIFLPIFFLLIIGSYLIGIGSVRDAIKTEKRKHLIKINEKLSVLANHIISGDNSKDIDSNKLNEFSNKFKILDEMGTKINDIPENPKTMTAIFRIVSSGLLPVISFLGLSGTDFATFIF